MDHCAEEHDASCLVSCSDGDGDKVEQCREAEGDLDVGHGECGHCGDASHRRESSTESWAEGLGKEGGCANIGCRCLAKS